MNWIYTLFYTFSPPMNVPFVYFSQTLPSYNLLWPYPTTTLPYPTQPTPSFTPEKSHTTGALSGNGTGSEQKSLGDQPSYVQLRHLIAIPVTNYWGLPWRLARACSPLKPTIPKTRQCHKLTTAHPHHIARIVHPAPRKLPRSPAPSRVPGAIS